MHLASLIGFAKWCLIAMVLANFNPFVALRMNTPTIFTWMSQNKLYACLMVFFLSNTIEGQLISTGAFEIIFNDVPVWSKIETGIPIHLHYIYNIYSMYICILQVFCQSQTLFLRIYEVFHTKQNLQVENGCHLSGS
ncbi:thioredoxin reductase-like selenoprotein T1b [Trichonephila inaurata madagascariensis]|uniref:Thioredoxin reductase-like selenoprotein T1b n=1 Tax=Trichonephila inaurata madagascariensis TaxID=2747483 RepID=A0A8X7CBE8_9ARAC|nr:thioredoxin reductase-like selenoprotein T1b [Trichonephila inaurata madagascariensis]